MRPRSFPTTYGPSRRHPTAVLLISLTGLLSTPATTTPPLTAPIGSQLTCSFPIAAVPPTTHSLQLSGTSAGLFLGVSAPFGGIGTSLSLQSLTPPHASLDVLEARSGAGAGFQFADWILAPNGVSLLTNQSAGNARNAQWGLAQSFSQPSSSSLLAVDWAPRYTDTWTQPNGSSVGTTPCEPFDSGLNPSVAFNAGAVDWTAQVLPTAAGSAVHLSACYSQMSLANQYWAFYRPWYAQYFSRRIASEHDLRVYLGGPTWSEGPIRPQHPGFSVLHGSRDGNATPSGMWDWWNLASDTQYILLVWRVGNNDLGVAVSLQGEGAWLRMEETIYCDDPGNQDCGSIDIATVGPGTPNASFPVGSLRTHCQSYHMGSPAELASLGFGRTPALPHALTTDATPGGALTSDANGILEPGEIGLVRTSWRNPSDETLSLCSTVTGLSGPPGSSQQVLDHEGTYGQIGAQGVSGVRTAAGDGYRVSVTSHSVRPSTHWDITLLEQLSSGQRHAWTVHVGLSFADVPRSDPGYYHIENIFHQNLMEPCSASSFGLTMFCPNDAVTKDLVADVLSRALSWPSMTIPTAGVLDARLYYCTAGGLSLYSDVTPGSSICAPAHYAGSRGLHMECAPNSFCPHTVVYRSDVAKYLAYALNSGAELPASGSAGFQTYNCSSGGHSLFSDVAPTDSFCSAVHFLYSRGVTYGCGASSFCPFSLVSRWQLAVLVSRAFAFPTGR